MTKGYLIFAKGSEYLKMATLLADSIRTSQSTIQDVTIISDSYTNNIMSDRAMAYELSPYDETVLLDADMIFLDDVSHWWNHLSRYPLVITNKVKNYRNDWVTTSPYRKTFIANNLPNCYSGFCYFKKGPVAEEFFTLVKEIIKNWEDWTIRFAPEDRQKWPSIDLAMAIASNVLDLDCFSQLEYPTFTHMKSGCQGWNYYNETWRAHLGLYVTDGRVRLGNYIQTGILHYVDKEVSNELLRLL
jgi:hypothetical protein